MVEGTINGFPFQVALETGGHGSYCIKVSKAMHDGAGADVGETVTVEILRVGEGLESRVPVELSRAIKAFPKAQAMWADITPIARRDWILWISTAKQPETRKRRIGNTCDMLASGKRRVCCFGGMKWLMKAQTTSGKSRQRKV